MKADNAALRAESKADNAELRSRTDAGFATLRAEVKADIDDLKLAIARLDADKPSKTYMWGILAVLLTAYACGLAALAILK